MGAVGLVVFSIFEGTAVVGAEFFAVCGDGLLGGSLQGRIVRCSLDWNLV